VTGGRWRRIVLGDVLAEHVVELRGRARDTIVTSCCVPRVCMVDRQTSYQGKHGLHAPVMLLSIHTCTCREAGTQIPPTQGPLCTLHPSRKQIAHSHPSSPRSSKTAPKASPSACTLRKTRTASGRVMQMCGSMNMYGSAPVGFCPQLAQVWLP
jgi:hypothetical protein